MRIPPNSELGGLDEDRATSLTIQAAPLTQTLSWHQSDLILSATTEQGATPGTSSATGLLGEPVWTHGKAIHLTEAKREADFFKKS